MEREGRRGGNSDVTVTGWWFGTFFSFFRILGIIIPTPRGVETTNQYYLREDYGFTSWKWRFY
jgi:hypothetical protein